MNMSIKKGDNVVVIAGKEKGKTGKVLEVYPESNRVLVDNVNIVTKHKKARRQDEKSAIVKKSAPIEASNVMVVCPTCGKATRIHHKEINGKKVRVCKCGVSLDKEYVKPSKKDAKKANAEKPVKKETTKPAKPAAAVEKKAAKAAKPETKKAEPKTTKPVAKAAKPAAKTETKAAKPAAKTETKAAKSGTKTTTTQKSNKNAKKA